MNSFKQACGGGFDGPEIVRCFGDFGRKNFKSVNLFYALVTAVMDHR